MRQTEVSHSAGQRRKQALQNRKILGDGSLTEQFLPKSLMSFLGEKIFGLNLQSGDMNIQQCKGAEANKTDHSPLLPIFFDTCTRFDTLLAAFEKRLAKATEVLSADTRTKDMWTNLTLLRSKGASSQAFEGLEWVPPTFGPPLFKDLKPVHPETFGQPWGLFAVKWGFIQGFKQLPFPGLGAFLSPAVGKFLVLMFPMAALHEAKADVHEQLAYFDALPTAQCTSFMQEHCIWKVTEVESYICLLCLPYSLQRLRFLISILV